MFNLFNKKQIAKEPETPFVKADWKVIKNQSEEVYRILNVETGRHRWYSGPLLNWWALASYREMLPRSFSKDVVFPDTYSNSGFVTYDNLKDAETAQKFIQMCENLSDNNWTVVQ